MSYNRVDRSLFVIQNKPLDAKRGPWASTAEACANIPINRRDQGLTVGIINAGSIVEYWWKDGVQDIDLVAKSSGSGGGDMTKAVYDTDDDGVVDKSETTQIIVRNSTGSTISKGKVVYLSGATGNRPNALLASASSEATSSKTIGIVVADIANNSDGYVAVNGTLHDLDLNTFTAGNTLWLSNTPGDYVANTPPAEPSHAVFIGVVARAHPTQGRLVLAIQNGYELGELHGVEITTPATNDFVYYASDGLWKNKQLSASDIPTGIDATKIGAGAVSNTEFGYLDGVTSAIQTQINGKQATLTNPVTGTGTNNEIAAFNSTGSTITSLSTSTYPSLTELSYIKGLTSAIQTQINALPRVIYTNYTAESVTSTSTSNALSTFALTVADADWPLGGIVKIIFAMDRTAGTGQSYLGIQINSSTSRWVGAGGTSLVGELNFMKEAANTVRVHYGPSNTSNGPYQAQNSTSVTATASGGNYVFSFLCYVQSGTSTTVAFRYMKALMIP